LSVFIYAAVAAAYFGLAGNLFAVPPPPAASAPDGGSSGLMLAAAFGGIGFLKWMFKR
jgi:hypothetical protein